MIKWEEVARWWKFQRNLKCMYSYFEDLFLILDVELQAIVEVHPDYIYQTKRAIYASIMGIQDEYSFDYSVKPGNC